MSKNIKLRTATTHKQAKLSPKKQGKPYDTSTVYSANRSIKDDKQLYNAIGLPQNQVDKLATVATLTEGRKKGISKGDIVKITNPDTGKSTVAWVDNVGKGAEAKPGKRPPIVDLTPKTAKKIGRLYHINEKGEVTTGTGKIDVQILAKATKIPYLGATKEKGPSKHNKAIINVLKEDPVNPEKLQTVLESAGFKFTKQPKNEPLKERGKKHEPDFIQWAGNSLKKLWHKLTN